MIVVCLFVLGFHTQGVNLPDDHDHNCGSPVIHEPPCTLIHGYIKTPNTNFVFLLQSMPYDVKIGPH